MTTDTFDPMAEEAAAARPEWRERPIVRVTRKDETPDVEDRCLLKGRMQWQDRIAYGTAPGVVCMLRDGHDGPHFDGIDGVHWEVVP